MIVPLVIGVATGKLEYGSYAALGALQAGFVAFRGVSRTRVLAVVLAAAGMAVSTFAGATAAHSAPWLLVPLVFVWAYAVGLVASLGPTVLAVTLQWPIALLIASALPLTAGPALIRAGLVLAGGLWQSVLVITSWTVSRGSAERSALAESLRQMAGYASGLAAGQQGPPPAGGLTGSYVLTDPNPLMRSAARQHMTDLAEETERLRATLTALSIAPAAAESRPAGQRVLGGTARVLTDLAAAVSSRPAARAGHLDAARRELDSMGADADATWQWAGEALLGQLRTVIRIAGRLNAAEGVPEPAERPHPIRNAWTADARLTVRASIGTSSESGRHALRLAVVSALAQVLALGSGLPHGYWIVLTIFIVLRPDYSSTLYRGLQRAAGTVVGAGLGVATVLLVKVSLTALLVVIAISLLAAFSVFTVNYLMYAVFLTDFIVVLLALLGLPPDPTALARLVGTGIGTGLAILAYVLWPSWESTSAAEKFARLIAAQGGYASALLRAYSAPGGIDARRQRQLQLAARRARSDAEVSADRLAGEPASGPVTPGIARALESVGHRMAQANLTLGAAVAAHHVRRAAAAGGQPLPAELDPDIEPQLDRLADGVTAATGILAGHLRLLGSLAPGPAAAAPLPPLPQLRPMLQAMWTPAKAPGGNSAPGDVIADAADAVAATEGSSRAGLFLAADGLVDAINTAGDVLRGPAVT